MRRKSIAAVSLVLLAAFPGLSCCIYVRCEDAPERERPVFEGVPPVTAEPPDLVSRKDPISIDFGGLLWYILDEIDSFDFGTVRGGPIGAVGGELGTVLFLESEADPFDNQWYFVDGDAMSVKPNPAGNPVLTSDRGHRVESSQTVVDPAPESDAKWTTMKLLSVFDVNDVLLHVPLLTGNTWGGGGGFGQGGATLEEAADVLDHLGLTWAIANPDPDGRKPFGRVTAQDPVGGTPAQPGDVVTLTLDWRDPDVQTPAGDNPNIAIPILGEGEIRGELSVYHTDALTKASQPFHPGCFGRGPDVFFKLPAAAQGQRVIVAEDSVDLVVLSAWKRVSGGPLTLMMSVGGLKPACTSVVAPPPFGSFGAPMTLEFASLESAIEFDVPSDPDTEVFVMVEHQTRDTSGFRLLVVW